ncbi:PQQ-like beta-propeller repeat protein [bacterium]|nr:PQQ-like beta-propeller repeat protein [bacterium]
MRKIIALLILCSLALSVQASDWPKWRGPHNTGISHETEWNPKALAGIPNIVWKSEIGKGHSGIVIKGDRLFSMGNKLRFRGTDTTYVDEVICIDRRTGRTLWLYTYPCGNRNWPGPRATPTVEGETLYTVSWDGQFYAFDINTGSVRWFHQLVEEGLSEQPNWGFSGSAAIEGDLVIMAAGKRGIAFNKHSGAVVWNNGKGAPTLPTPLIYEADGKKVVALAEQRNYHVLDIKTGETLASYPFYTTDIDPILIDNELFMASGQGSRMLKLNGIEYESVMDNRRSRFSAWQNFVIVNGHAYGFFRQGRRAGIQCIETESGEVKWRENLGVWGSVMAAGDHLIILTGSGHLKIIDASPDAYNLQSEASVMKMGDNIGLDMAYQCFCWTQPVFLDSQIFARNNWGEIICVDMK